MPIPAPSPSPSPTPPAYSVLQSRFFTSSFGVAVVGMSGTRHLYLTYSGGRRWREITPKGLIFAPPQLNRELDYTNAITLPTFVDQLHGWLPVSQNPDDGGWLFVTRDGGYTWTRTLSYYVSHHAGSSDSFDFVDSMHTFLVEIEAAAPDSYFLTSTDGGIAFSGTRAPGIGNGGKLPSIKPAIFWSASDGWSYNYERTGYFVSHDAGRSWQLHSFDGVIPPASDNGRLVGSPTFFSRRTGIESVYNMEGTQEVLHILRTDDAGDHWRPIASSPIEGDLHSVPGPNVSVTPVTATTWLERGPHGYRLSGDSGTTWRPLTLNALPRLTGQYDPASPDIGLVTAVDGVLVGAQGGVGHLYITHDAGRSWLEQRPGR
ncbi:MAG: hypothetical protein ACR2MY_12180 [Candidatus Dormibacteria bacterium]